MPNFLLIQLYNALAPEYERTRVPRMRPFVKKLLQLYDTRPGSIVLDAGCGTGLAASMVAPRVGHSGKILGVDASPNMLEIARTKAQGFGFTQCEFVEGDITRLDVPDETFDLVMCSFALWGEPNALFAEFRRMLKPHGALLMQNWLPQRDEATQAFSKTLAEFPLPAPVLGVAELRQALEEEKQLWSPFDSPAAYASVLSTLGFNNIQAQATESPVRFASLAELVEFYTLGIRASAEIAMLDADRRAEFENAATECMRPFDSPNGIQLIWSAIQVVARKPVTR